MAEFQPPPTWALPILVEQNPLNPQEIRSQFNPIWLKWFVDLVAVINAAGGGSGGIEHNSTTGLQGGTANQFYHFTANQNTLLAKLVAGVGRFAPPDDDGTAQTVCALYAGNGAPSNANGNNGDFFFRGDGAAGTFIYHKAAGAWTAFV